MPFRVIQGHRFWYRKLIYDFLLVINTNVPPILHRFRHMAFHSPKSLFLAIHLVFNLLDGGVPWDDLRKIFRECQRMTMVPNGLETLPKISTG